MTPEREEVCRKIECAGLMAGQEGAQFRDAQFAIRDLIADRDNWKRRAIELETQKNLGWERHAEKDRAYGQALDDRDDWKRRADSAMVVAGDYQRQAERILIDRDTALARAEKAERELSEAREVLRLTEWSARLGVLPSVCLICANPKTRGHTSDCWLLAALSTPPPSEAPGEEHRLCRHGKLDEEIETCPWCPPETPEEAALKRGAEALSSHYVHQEREPTYTRGQVEAAITAAKKYLTATGSKVRFAWPDEIEQVIRSALADSTKGETGK